MSSLAIAGLPVYSAIGALGSPMTPKAPPKLKDRTWRDVMGPGWPDPELLTRGELIETLQAAGIDASGRTLAYWEANQIIPRAVRRHYKGATQAVYPVWMIQVVAAVREMQTAGLSLEDIRDAVQLGFEVGEWVQPPDRETGQTMTRPQVQERWRSYYELAEALEPMLAELGYRWWLATGRYVADMSIQYRDEAGQETGHVLIAHPWQLDVDAIDGGPEPVNWIATVDHLKSVLIGEPKSDTVREDRE